MAEITQEQDEILRKYFTKHYIMYGSSLVEWNENPDMYEADEKMWDIIHDFPYIIPNEMLWVTWAKQNKYFDWKNKSLFAPLKLTDKFIDKVISGE